MRGTVAEPPGRITGFPAGRTARLAELEGWHFWFAGRRRLIERLLARHVAANTTVLDLGCGTASLAERMATGNHRVIGLDRSAAGLRNTGHNAPALLKLQADAAHLPLKTSSIDAVLAFDVLEHLDDRTVLAELHDALAPDGVIILTVPAVPWLWSYRDEAAGHLRRYTRRGLHRLLADAGYDVVESHFYQFLLFPAVALARLAGRSGPEVRDLEERPAGPLNAVLTKINLFEVALGAVVPWPIGSSLAVVCRKAP